MRHSAILSTKRFCKNALLMGAFVCTFTGNQAFSQSLYFENFESYPVGTTTSTEWSIEIPSGSSPDHFDVRNFNGGKWFEGKKTDGNVYWRTKWIHVSGSCDITASVKYDESGELESDDCIEVLYSKNNSTPVQFSSNGERCNDFGGSKTATQNISVVAGDSVQITVRINNDGSGEYHRFDNVSVSSYCPATNPDLVGTCPMDMIFVLDESGSIGRIVDTVRAAADSLVTNLVGSGTRLAVAEFDAGARRAKIGNTTAYRTVDASYLADFHTYLYGSSGNDNEYYHPGGMTNWDRALDTVHSMNIDDGVAPLVLVFTDGEPTASDGPGTHLQDAVESANTVKSDGSHIFVVGVPNPTLPESNVIAISGPDKFPSPQSDFSKGDYSIGSDTTLINDLQKILQHLFVQQTSH